VVNFDPMMARKDAALARLSYFHEEYPKELGIDLPKITVKKEVRFGIPGFTITDYAQSNHFDLIIMGTRDQHNLFDKMLGSASTIAIRTAACPILLIHEHAKYNTPEKIVFAFDEKSDIENALEHYWKINSVVKAKTDFIHVNTNKQSKIKDQAAEIIDEMLEEHEAVFSFEIKTITGKKVQSALRDYCLFEKSDILAMTHRKEGVFSNLFRRHQSVKMAQEFHLPVLIFQEQVD